MSLISPECFSFIDSQDVLWVYDICLNKNITQRRKEGDKVVEEFSLGVYELEKSDLGSEYLESISIPKGRSLGVDNIV